LTSFTGPVLHKPVEPTQLTLTVRSCLSGARAFQKSSER
jgi:hypothetical protein